MDDLRSRQLVQLEILKDVAKVCDENGIDYALACGTMLGAIRHKGFIPWDDDIDIFMTVENYRKFCEIGQNCLGEKYFVQNWRTEKEYAELWTQVRLNNTTAMPIKYVKWNIHFGIHIDIFPVIGISDNKDEASKQYKYFQMCRSLLATDFLKAIGNKAHGKQNIVNIIPRFIRRMICGYFEKKLFISPKDTDNSAEVWSKLITFPSRLFYDLTDTLFEDEMFKAMRGYDEYLTIEYGDYMTPPKEENRGGHIATMGEIIRDAQKDYKEYKEELLK